MKCSYCGNGPFKEEQIEYNGGIGGFINDYWFCQWCLDYGMRDKADTEKERWKKLVKKAES